MQDAECGYGRLQLQVQSTSAVTMRVYQNVSLIKLISYLIMINFAKDQAYTLTALGRAPAHYLPRHFLDM